MVCVDKPMQRPIPKTSVRWYSDLIAASRQARTGTGKRLRRKMGAC
ncbi:hypothetical protein GRB70_38460 [Bradyrhizobium neotropicale]|nr:hypothetical protein [Bradyrhizobium neotropicale]